MQFFKIRKSSYGILAALCAVFIWAGWVVSSRWGITTDFSPVDLTWLRFSTASLVLLPGAPGPVHPGVTHVSPSALRSAIGRVQAPRCGAD